MKKLFTIVALALMTLGANAQEEVDIPLDKAAWGWGWNSTVDVTDGVMSISLVDNYGAGGTGWDPATDWSSYAKLCVVIDSYTGGWGQVVITFSDNSELSQTFGSISSQTTITADIEKNDKSSGVKKLVIQGGTGTPVIKVSRVYLIKKLEYEEGENIPFDQYGNILAENLASFSNSAKVEYTVTASIVTEEKYIGWGIGRIGSLDGSVTCFDFALKNDGDNVYTCTMADLRAALEAPANEYGQQGINWNVWGQGKDKGNEFTRKSFVVYEVKNTCEVVVGPAGYTTFSYNKAIGLGGVNAYTAKYEGGKAKLTKVTAAPAGAGVIIEAAEGTYKIPTLDSAADLVGNDLLVSDGTATSDGHFFALAEQGGVVGFYKVALGVKIPAGKAYLNIPLLSRDFVGFDFGGEATAIDAVESVKQPTDAAVYNLAGQRVSKPARGLYIMNGKKVIIK